MISPPYQRTWSTLCLTLALFALPCCLLLADSRPNIVLIMVDDMGFSDLGCYGGEIETPNIDRLAAGGVKFSQFYNSGRCCPTRATLMTGLHPHQVGIGHMTLPPNAKRKKDAPPAYEGLINRDCVTIAEVLGTAGYTTLMTGKWHLGAHDQDCWPLQRGFSKYYGCLAGGTCFFAPKQPREIRLGNEPETELQSTTDRPYYVTDAFTDYAIRFIEEADAESEAPYFLYLAYTAPHWPIQAHEEELAKYRGRYRKGWDQLRKERYQRQFELGLIDPDWALSPRDAKVPAWESLDEQKQDEMDLRMALYAAMVDRVDQNIGKLIDCLKRQGEFDNTLIVFLSDNGACAEGGILGNGEVYDREARNSRFGVISYGRAWANLSSTPYRLYKHFAHEGGACTPFFMHWPDRISPHEGWYRAPAQLIDVLPTCLEVADAAYPGTFKGKTIPPLDGISLTPAFENKPLARQQPIFIEHETNAFVRDGNWKLVGRSVAAKRGVVKGKWELYDMTADGTELNNLASKHPGVVQKYDAQWRDWANRIGVYPKVVGKPQQTRNTKNK